MARSKTKYVFVTGGVMSSVGKGVSTASIAFLPFWHNFNNFHKVTKTIDSHNPVC